MTSREQSVSDEVKDGFLASSSSIRQFINGACASQVASSSWPSASRQRSRPFLPRGDLHLQNDNILPPPSYFQVLLYLSCRFSSFGKRTRQSFPIQEEPALPAGAATPERVSSRRICASVPFWRNLFAHLSPTSTGKEKNSSSNSLLLAALIGRIACHSIDDLFVHFFFPSGPYRWMLFLFFFLFIFFFLKG